MRTAEYCCKFPYIHPGGPLSEGKNTDTGPKAAIIACSNGLPESRREQMDELAELLKEEGLEPIFSDCLYWRNGTAFSGTPKERAESLMDFFRDPEVRFIFDVSGGDAANGILPFLNYQEIRESRAVFWGYSDLTTVLNAIYAKTGKESVLYQARNLTHEEGSWQRGAFRKFMAGEKTELFNFSYEFIQGNRMEGRILGGNMRCLLKLSGTEYWPDMKGKILLLEASGGLAPQMASCLAQLRQMGVFETAGGILLGTFLRMEEEGECPGIEALVKEYAGPDIPIARTVQIGQRPDSRGAVIGSYGVFES